MAARRSCHRTILLGRLSIYFSDQVLHQSLLTVCSIINMGQFMASRITRTVIGGEVKGGFIYCMLSGDWMIAFVRLAKPGTRRSLRSDMHPSGGADVGRSDAFSKKLIH